MSASLFSGQGRRSVPLSVVATMMALQRLGGLSDREAVDWYTFEVRWRARPGWAATARGGRGLRRRYWSTYVNGCAARSARIGFGVGLITGGRSGSDAEVFKCAGCSVEQESRP
jgi:hypothetical protein